MTPTTQELIAELEKQHEIRRASECPGTAQNGCPGCEATHEIADRAPLILRALRRLKRCEGVVEAARDVCNNADEIDDESDGVGMKYIDTLAAHLAALDQEQA